MRSSPLSPTSSRAPVAKETVQLQAMQFFDDWHARIMKTSLGKVWTRNKAVMAALDLLALNGVALSQEDIEWMSNQPDEIMVPELCSKLSFEQLEGFDSLAQTLQVLLLTTARVRLALDSGDSDELSAVMSEEDHGSIKDAIMKEAVIRGSREVGHLSQCQDTWVRSMERRLVRLTHSAESAHSAHQQLLKVEALLETVGPKSKFKTKKALVGFCSLNVDMLKAASFSLWVGLALKNRAERELRKALEAELEKKESKLIQIKEQSLVNIKNAMQRSARNTDEAILAAFFAAWEDERGASKREAQEEKQLEELSGRLNDFSEERVRRAKQMFAKMSSDNNGSLLVTFFQGWTQATKESQQQRALDEEVAAKQAQLKEYLAKSKSEAKARLERGLMQTDSSLLQGVMMKWFQLSQDRKGEREVQQKIQAADHKFKNLKLQLKGAAYQTQSRVSDQLRMNLMVQVVQHWELETKVNRVEKYYKAKMDGKRKQLDSVRTLFRSFADKLEEGLSGIDKDEESSGRGGRSSRRISGRPGLSKGEGSVSLPDIHAGRHA